MLEACSNGKRGIRYIFFKEAGELIERFQWGNEEFELEHIKEGTNNVTLCNDSGY